MSQQSRRHDPYPWTWEIPLGVVLVILMVLVCGVHLGRGIANVLGGAGWAFPRRVELFRSLPAVLAGDAAAGLDGLNGSVSSPSAVWMWVLVTEVIPPVQDGGGGSHWRGRRGRCARTPITGWSPSRGHGLCQPSGRTTRTPCGCISGRVSALFGCDL
jgi:hypothetical protein